VFDTETTWFINKKENNLDLQPRIIQFAWIIWEIKDWNFIELERIDILINPTVPIPYSSSKVHNIYDIDIKQAPIIETVINDILSYINKSDLIVGHNIEYDEDVLKIELSRLWKLQEYNVKERVCTMKETVNYCKLRWNWERFKYPKLWELHKKLFWEYFIGAHDAMKDVEATLKCFIELINKKIIKLDKKENNIMSLF